MYKITVPTIITNGHFNKEKTLSELKRCKAERIALALDREVGEAFSSQKNLEFLKENLEFFRENGIEALVWLGETFGHDGSPASGNSPYRHIKTFLQDDTKPFCPLDENFKKDFCNWVVKVAECGADMIMLDDDFRLSYRGSSLGCCCDLHMQKIEEELGEKITREELVQKAFTGGENRYRDAWLKVQSDSMKSFCTALRQALDKVSPQTRLSFCAAPGHWDSDGADAITLAKILAGNTKPFLRLTGAPYWCSQWGGSTTLGDVIEYARQQLKWCRHEDIEIFAEGDTYPRPRITTPASYLEVFDEVLRADAKSDGILKYMLDYVSDADYETGYIDAHVRNAGLYKDIEKYFAPKTAVGLRPYNRMKLVNEADFGETPDLQKFQSGLFSASSRMATDLSLPISREDSSVNIVFGENARHVSVRKLKNGSIIDITAAKLLMERGFDIGIDKFEENEEILSKGFSDVPQGYFIEEDIYIRLNGGISTEAFSLKKGAEVLTEYVYSGVRRNGIFEYKNESGLKFLVLPFDADSAKYSYGWLDSYALRRLILRWLERIEKPLCAYVKGNHPRLYTMVKTEEKRTAVGIWNTYNDTIYAAEIVFNDEISDVKFINCKGRKNSNSVILETPVYPYEFAGIEVKIK